MFAKYYSFVAFQVLSLIILILFLELSVRFFCDPIIPIDINAGTMITGEGQEPYFQYHPFAAFSWIPNSRFLRQTVNSQGFVSTREIPFEKKPGELRIITLGGSSTVGNGNIDEETYPRILEKMLQQKFPDKHINIINGAAGGYSTRESLGYLQSRLIYYRPDIVIIMHGWNDMYYFTKTDIELSQWRKDFNLQTMWNPNVGLKLKDPMPKDLQYLSWSQLYLQLRDFTRRKLTTNGANTFEKRYDGIELNKEGNPVLVTKRINNHAYDIYKNNLIQIRNFCDINNITIFSILQPTLFSDEGQQIINNLQLANETSIILHAFNYQKHLEVFRNMYTINFEVFGKDYIIDATSMNGKEEYFFDHVHQKPLGTTKLAAFVFEKIGMKL